MESSQYAPKDFMSTQDVRWCPGCGDYIILKQLQIAMSKSGSIPHQTAVISGIGCSSRLPYYMNTYGFHTIHGRALAISSGLIATRPDLEVWVITGDGDSLSIGTNHLIHFLRRNQNANIILINNKIYGLTKGQFSPTSDTGQYSKSSPNGNDENPVNALMLALSSGATFLARSTDRHASHLQSMMIASKEHLGSSLLEVLQNCPIFNDGIFDLYTQRESQSNHTLMLELGREMTFGDEANPKCIYWSQGMPQIGYRNQVSDDVVWIHDPENYTQALWVVQFAHGHLKHFPLPLGVLYHSKSKLVKKNKISQISENQLFEAISKHSFDI